MNDDARALAETRDYLVPDDAVQNSEQIAAHEAPCIPNYLQETYWWAYLHPKSFLFFERAWVVNIILWGNMNRLTAAVLDELQLHAQSRVLQVACVYGDFSNRLATRLKQSQSHLDLVDVASIQLRNAEKKLGQHDNVSFHHQDSNDLSFSNAGFDETVIFFLLHEQPAEARRKTISEAIRVTRPGGKVIFVDYHGPRRSNPLRYVMQPILAWLEPFAMDLWREELAAFLPPDIEPEQVSSTFYCGGLYQKVILKL